MFPMFAAVAVILGFSVVGASTTADSGTVWLKNAEAPYFTISNDGMRYYTGPDSYISCQDSQCYVKTTAVPEPAKCTDAERVLHEENAQLTAAVKRERDYNFAGYLLAVPAALLTLLGAFIFVLSRLDKIVGAWRRAEVKLPSLPKLPKGVVFTFGTFAANLAGSVIAASSLKFIGLFCEVPSIAFAITMGLGSMVAMGIYWVNKAE